MQNTNSEEEIVAQPPLSQEGHPAGNLPASHDKDVATGNSLSPGIPLGASTEPTKADVTLIGTEISQKSQGWEIVANKPCLHDCLNLSKTDLRKRYPREANSHKHMLERAESHGRTIHPWFREFRDFLGFVGPKPCPTATLDRIDNSDPEYAPGKVRWADKRTQSNNKGDTLIFHDPKTSAQFTASRLAKLQQVSQSTIRKRLERGWRDEEIIAGKRLPQTPVPSPVLEPKKAPAPDNVLSPPLEGTWLRAINAAYPGEWCALTGKEKKMLRDLAKHCSGGGLADHVEDVLDYTIKNWIGFADRAKSYHGAFNTPTKPAIEFLWKHIRVAVNLWLDANDMEIKEDGVPRPRPEAVGTGEEAVHSRTPPDCTSEAGASPARDGSGRLMRFDPYASGILNREEHERLVANIVEYAKDAGIQPRWIWTAVADTCSETEIEYLRAFRRIKIAGTVQGLCYFRKTKDADPETRMFAIAGCLVRNFCRARVMTLGVLLDHIAKDGDVPATCLLVPNFALSKGEGGHLAPWQSQAIYDLLVQRASDRVQTILYATSAAAISDMYGLAARRTIETHFLKVEI